MTGFEHPDEEEIHNGLVDWLRKARDQYQDPPGNPQYEAIDWLLDETRDAGVEGYLPWQR